MGIFTWLEPGLKNRWSDASILAKKASTFLAKIEASYLRFFQNSYSFTLECTDG